MATELRLVRATAYLRTTGVLVLLVSLVSCLPVLLWSDRYGPTTHAVQTGAYFGTAFLFTAWWSARYFGKRLAKPLDDLPARFALLPEQREFDLVARRLTGLLVLVLVFMGGMGLLSGFPYGMPLAGAAAGLLAVSRWVAGVERKRGGRLVYLLVPGPGHTGTRLWIAREPS